MLFLYMDLIRNTLSGFCNQTGNPLIMGNPQGASCHLMRSYDRLS